MSPGLVADRAAMLASVRSFFASRGVTEVDVPIASRGAFLTSYIDPFSIESGFLHPTAEYGMKRLLASGIGDIYQLSHVFRKGEEGKWHNPEFMMVEWYRHKLTFEKIQQEAVALIELFLGKLPIESLSYWETFEKHIGINPDLATISSLKDILMDHNIEIDKSLLMVDKSAYLTLILATLIEPNLGENGLFILSGYPKVEAQLAKSEGDFAFRFEIYHKGVELGNGALEQPSGSAMRNQMELDNKTRELLGKKALPLDENFLRSVEKGLPECAGVAVGFDRLMMLRHKKWQLADILPLPWQVA